MTFAESVDLKSSLKLIPAEQRQLPDNFNKRTGHMQPLENSLVIKQLKDTESYATNNFMKINYSKTQLMLFNPCWSIDFLPEMSMENHDLEIVSEKKLLELIVRSDLKWTTNTTNFVNRAY